MAFKFASKLAAQPTPADSPEAQPASHAEPAKTGSVVPLEKAKPKFSFLARGAQARALVAQNDAKVAARQEAAGKLRRFLMKYNTDTQITFLDGRLDETGLLDVPRWKEHFLKIGNTPSNFQCTAGLDDSLPCPICEMGNDFQPALVGALTIIDHSEYTVQTGPNAGKIYKNQKKLFIAKDGTLKTLNKLAAKPDRNGLAGCTFDVSRGPENKKPPAVGDVFDFVMKHKNLASIAEKYGIKVEELGPADYDDEIPFLSPAKLLEMGIGKQPGGIGYEKGYNKAAADL